MPRSHPPRALALATLAIALTGLAAARRVTRAQSTEPSITQGVVGHADVHVGTCCGGAWRPETDGCETVHAYEGPIEVRAGRRSVGPALARTTAHHGRFSLALPPGTYCVVAGDKVAAPGGALGVGTASVDEACLAAHRRTCDAIVRVRPDAIVHARVSVAAPCFGVCYRGPMPP